MIQDGQLRLIASWAPEGVPANELQNFKGVSFQAGGKAVYVFETRLPTGIGIQWNMSVTDCHGIEYQPKKSMGRSFSELCMHKQDLKDLLNKLHNGGRP